jgi:hypothetical protein
MASPPTIVSYTGSGNTATNPQTTGVTTPTIAGQASDLAVAWGAAEDEARSGPLTISFPTGSVGTVTVLQSDATANYAPVVLVVATLTASGNFTAKALGTVNTTALQMNVGCWLVRNHGGVGTSGKSHQAAGTTPSLALTGVQDNSALLCALTDWAAVNTARTYLQVNGANPTERAHFADGATYHFDGFDYADSGAAGTKTVGESAPTGQTPNLVAVEILAAAASVAGQPIWTPHRMPLGV